MFAYLTEAENLKNSLVVKTAHEIVELNQPWGPAS